MGSLTKTAKKCRECPFSDKCDEKRMEGYCYYDNSMVARSTVDEGISAGEISSQPAIIETMTINLGDIMTKDLKDEIEKELYKALREPFMLNYGA